MNWVQRSTGGPASVARAALRVTVGALFVGHGAQKLRRPEEASVEMEEFGLRPPRLVARAAGLSQVGGGMLLIAGFLTPVGCAAVATTAITAMRTACAGKGPWAREGGWEYPLVLALAAGAMAADGPGALSLDRLTGAERSGLPVAAATIGAAATASVLTTAIGRHLAFYGAEHQPVPTSDD